MHVQVVDRESLRKGHFRNEKPYLLLAAYDPDKRPPRTEPGDHNGVGYLAFPITDTPNPDTPQAMTPGHARAYAEMACYAQARQLAGGIVCADEHGIHRSAALAAALSDFFNDGVGGGKWVKAPYHPNPLVYRLLLAAFKALAAEDAGKAVWAE